MADERQWSAGRAARWADPHAPPADPPGDGLEGKLISVRGVVQGVGFRPFVYRLARHYGLAGWVLNHSGGVDINVEGPGPSLERFLDELQGNPPALARIASIETRDRPPDGCLTFEIRESRNEVGRYQLISPDIATCPDCLRELFDPGDRRYRYPFTNCTNCGPRFTIIADIPYDRPNTTMGRFQMCRDCQREYDDPLDRRFHAQPNACPVCGPQVWLVQTAREPRASGADLEPQSEERDHSSGDVIWQTARLLQEGAIVAVKGLGGFHLACDATNSAAVARLRERKGRLHKPLAVMMATLEEVRHHCRVSGAEEELLASRERPIVLLSWYEKSSVARNVAAGYHQLGVMLPYTPLHHVLLRDAERPLVMTSGNVSEEPICQSNEEAQERLAGIADAFLLHNRDIYARYDDSVWTVYPIAGSGLQRARQSPADISLLAQPVRRSRGYAPYPITLPVEVQPTLAVGAELKNTFCLARDRYAFVSQHIGDMENLETLEHFETSIDLLKHLFRIEPEMVVYDLHPEYLSTQLVLAHWHHRVPESRPTDRKRPGLRDGTVLVPVQHHHAHIASCLADNGWCPEDGPVIGIAWDGTGLGTDGRIWGGEWLVAEYRDAQRVGHLEYLPLPGGEAAIRNPCRIAAGYLMALGLSPTPFLSPSFPSEARLVLIRQQVERGLNTPQTSSAGRVFDAVSALLGVCERTTYEGQPAIELEQVAGCEPDTAAYPWHMDRVDGQWVVRLRPLFEALLEELERRTPVWQVSSRFHRTMASLIVEMCHRIRRGTGLGTVALSGGCFQNRLLLAQAVAGLREAGFGVLVHHQVPTNDGGLSLGQAVIANAQHRDRL